MVKGGHLAGEHWVLGVHQRKGVRMLPTVIKKENCQISMGKHASQVAEKKVTSRFVFLQKTNNDGHLLQLNMNKVMELPLDMNLAHQHTRERGRLKLHKDRKKNKRACTHRRAAKTW